MPRVDELPFGRVKLAAGTLYGAIRTILEKRWISALPGGKNSRKKEYEISESGEKIAENELLRLKELLLNGELIIKGDAK